MLNSRRVAWAGLSVLLISAFGGGLYAWLRSARPASPLAAVLSTAVVSERAFAPRVVATGNIRLLPGARIDVGARISGLVVSLPVTQGSHVNRGDIIARLDDREPQMRLAVADANIAELSASVRQLEAELSRTQSLARANGATEQEVLLAETTLATTRARLDAARNNRALAELQLGYTIIRAPISGIVSSVTTHEGETISASLAAPTFVSLLDPSRIECVALVDESDIGRIVRGDSADFTVDAYPGRTFHGVVVDIAPDATVLSGVVDYEVKVRIINPTLELKPQMTASIGIIGASHTSLVIPTSAVRQSALGTYVWRRKGGMMTRVNVTLGARQSDYSEVRTGLVKGDTVLTAGFPEAPAEGASK